MTAVAVQLHVLCCHVQPFDLCQDVSWASLYSCTCCVTPNQTLPISRATYWLSAATRLLLQCGNTCGFALLDVTMQ